MDVVQHLYRNDQKIFSCSFCMFEANNMEPQNGCSEEADFPFQFGDFQVPWLLFRGGYPLIFWVIYRSSIYLPPFKENSARLD